MNSAASSFFGSRERRLNCYDGRVPGWEEAVTIWRFAVGIILNILPVLFRV